MIIRAASPVRVKLNRIQYTSMPPSALLCRYLLNSRASPAPNQADNKAGVSMILNIVVKKLITGLVEDIIGLEVPIQTPNIVGTDTPIITPPICSAFNLTK
jgi:hypothetical protein